MPSRARVIIGPGMEGVHSLALVPQFFDFPYFWATFLMLGWIGVILLLFRENRKMIFLSGICGAPAGLFAFAFQDYWQPRRLGDLSVGIEDLLFCFEISAHAWVIALLLPSARALTFRGDFFKVLLRFLLIYAGNTAGFFLFAGIGFDSVSAQLLSLGAVTIPLVIRSPSWLSIWTLGVLVGPLVYGMFVVLFFSIWRGFRKSWIGGDFWTDTTVFGLPIGELAFAAIFSACWPLMFAFIVAGAARSPQR